ncbi:hypothetical protein ABZ636_15280 [Streptomyces sp. NPDC007251]|uniref:hypothetical protein n=1 Tax=Streptomyces sp. NPDC007251 TaxID=3154483 RepID=UPI0033E2D51D
MSDGGSANLRRGADALSKFSDGLSNALTRFEESPASPSRLGHHGLDRKSFGGAEIPFTEADDLHKKYTEVHDLLMSMSSTLRLHIEALQLAARSADSTYDGTEDEVRRRFWEIKTKLDQEFQKTHPEKQQPRKDTRQHTDDKSAGVSSK